MALKSLKNGIFMEKYNIGDAFMKENEEEKLVYCDPEEYWVLLREPTEEEAIKLMPKIAGQVNADSISILGECIVDHNVEIEEEVNGSPVNKKVSNKALWDELKKRSGVTSRLMRQWVESLPLSKMKGTS